LVLPGQKIPVWMRNIVSSLDSADEVSLSVVVLTNEQWSDGGSSRLFRVWKKLDYRAFQRKIEAHQYTEDLVDIEPERVATKSTFDDLGGKLLEDTTDIVIWMASRRPPIDLVSTPRFGCWTLAHAHNPAAGFQELVDGAPATACDLIRYGLVSDMDSSVATTFAATDRLSLSRGIIGVRAKNQALLMSTILRVHLHHKATIASLKTGSPVRVGQKSPRLLQTLWGLAKLYGRYCKDILKRPIYFDQWQIAYRIGGDRLDQKGMQRLAPPHKGFWADPFVTEYDGRRFIFFEEFIRETSRGHIAAIEVGPNGELGDAIDVLKSEFHLSYPFMFQHDGSLYMVPECSMSGRVEVFRCTQIPQHWERHAVLLDGVCAFDPTLIEHDGLWWMFVTIQHGGQSTDDALHLFYAPGPFDEWTAHPLNPVRLDVRSARPAGSLFREQGRLFRPAQDCSARYGWAISIQEVLRMTTDDYEEVEVCRILPDWAAGAHATHTINHGNGVTVYDCEVKRRR
jgi:hypothetical protein